MANDANRSNARATLITLMLREDHQKVKQLFDQYNDTTNTHEKWDIVRAAIDALEVHATLKEELIYPAWREHVEDQQLMDEARKELHVVYVLIAKLKNMDPEDERYDATFRVLREQVQHHMKEEEEKMFPQAEKTARDWERLTKHVIQRRQSLEHKPLWLLGVPVIASASETVPPMRAVLSRRAGGGGGDQASQEGWE